MSRVHALSGSNPPAPCQLSRPPFALAPLDAALSSGALQPQPSPKGYSPRLRRCSCPTLGIANAAAHKSFDTHAGERVFAGRRYRGHPYPSALPLPHLLLLALAVVVALPRVGPGRPWQIGPRRVCTTRRAEGSGDPPTRTREPSAMEETVLQLGWC